MSSLPSELWRHILHLRGDLCYRICRDSWKLEWLKDTAVVNKEYHRNWCWYGSALSLNEGFCQPTTVLYNYRPLQISVVLLVIGFVDNMNVYSGTSCIPSKANFSSVHYFYSLRGPQSECKDWFLRFFESNK